jgi:hypothetical protein
MSIKTFTTGEVLTAADTNTYLANGGLVYIKSQTIGSAVSSVAVTSAFSADYDAYKIVVQGGSASTNAGYLTLQLGATAANYRYDFISANLAGATPTSSGSVGAANFPTVGFKSSSLMASIEVVGPFASAMTMVSCPAGQTGNNMGWMTGVQIDATSFTAFTLGASTGTMTGGTITVYGYRKA